MGSQFRLGWSKDLRRVASASSLVAVAVGLTALANAQSAGTVRANDSAFKTSPMSSAGVTSKRDALRTFIWGNAGFPTGTPSLTTVSVCSGANCSTQSPVKGLTNLQRVDALQINTSGGGQSVDTTAYHFVPVSKNFRLVIVHQGHAGSNNICYLDDGPTSGNPDGGIQRTIKALVAAGYSVLGMTMPGYTPGPCTGGHDAMFATALPAGTGNALKFFMNPIAVAINALSGPGQYSDFNMTGLSGGGWATTVYAALDPRVRKSFPVAGTVPMYLRVESYNHDTEQFLPALYGANSPAVTGLAGYKDLYLLGATGSNRLQFQVLNRRDDLCFGESQHNAGVLGVSFESAVRTYESSLKTAVGQVGPGAFRTFIDEAAPGHMISDYAINQIILPTLNGITELATTMRSVWGNNLCIDIPDLGRPPQANDTLQLYVCHGGVNQGFYPRSDGTIRTQAGNLCLDIPDFGRQPQPGDEPQLYPCTGGVNQRFTFVSDGSIRTQWGTNLCLDVPNFGRPPQSNDPLQIYTCNGGSNQKFSVNR